MFRGKLCSVQSFSLFLLSDFLLRISSNIILKEIGTLGIPLSQNQYSQIQQQQQQSLNKQTQESQTQPIEIKPEQCELDFLFVKELENSLSSKILEMFALFDETLTFHLEKILIFSTNQSYKLPAPLKKQNYHVGNLMVCVLI